MSTAGWEEESTEDTRAEKASIQKSFRKIRRRWAMSLLILPLLLVMAVPAFMIANEIVEGVQNPDKVGVGEIEYSFYFVKFDTGLSLPFRQISMNWGDRSEELEEELVLYDVFYMQGNHLSRRLWGLE